VNSEKDESTRRFTWKAFLLGAPDPADGAGAADPATGAIVEISLKGGRAGDEVLIVRTFEVPFSSPLSRSLLLVIHLHHGELR